MSQKNGGFSNPEDWYEALKKVAGSHLLSALVHDFEAWTYNWQGETPEAAFYNEYPEYRED